MANLTKRTWYRRGPTGHRVKHVAYGYTLQVNGKQVRKTDARWSKEDAEAALAARQLERDVESAAPPIAPLTFGDAVERYLAAKSRKKSIADDRRHLATFMAA